jgi:mannose-1-phosphate guanylyltransferase
MDHFYALIMAGGGGTRLWPLSRVTRPKQALSLTEERSLIEVTVDRLDGLMDPAHIFIVASAALCALLRQNVPHIPAENFIAEPTARNSGPAAALGTYTIAALDPKAIIAVLSADHHIADEARFKAALQAAAAYADEGYIVTIGIDPDYAATGFGYIRREAKLGESDGLTVYRSGGFREKPDQATAEAFIQSGLYSWNAGMFIWKFDTLDAELEAQQPAMAAGLKRMVGPGSQAQSEEEKERIWATFPALSIDYLVMEQAQNVAVIPVDMGWSDVGIWDALYGLLPKDEQGNADRNDHHPPLHIDSRNMLVVGKKFVVTIGLEDIVIVETDDAILVCKRDRTQDVKKIVETLRATGQFHLT